MPMAKVLSISSQVVCGHVGNSAAAFVMQRMGHDVLAVPTIILSNRPGYKAIAGHRTDPQKLSAMLEAVLENGWLADVDAVLTGYVPTREHAEFCASWIAKIRTSIRTRSTFAIRSSATNRAAFTSTAVPRRRFAISLCRSPIS